MTDDNEFLHSLTLEEGKPVKFAALVYLIGKALHPGDDEEAAFRVACVNLEAYLQKAVQDGSLMVITSSGLDRKILAHSDTLQRAELIPDSYLESLLKTRGIGLRLIPSVNDGPVYWTLQNAAIAIQRQECWSHDTRVIFQGKLCKAASRGDLVMRDSLTGLPDESGIAQDTVNTVTRADVNDWLTRRDAPYTWKIASIEASEGFEKPLCGAESVSPKLDEQRPDEMPIEPNREKEIANTAARGQKMTRRALIAYHEQEWPNIATDIKGASENGLSDAAKAGKNGWYESDALAWARSKNKLKVTTSVGTLSAVMNSLPVKTHRLEG